MLYTLLLCHGLMLFPAASSCMAARSETCQFQGVNFTLFWVDIKTDQLSLHWKDDKGKPLETFSRLQEFMAGQSNKLLFAINSGIFKTDGTPLGLHIENDKVLCPLNLGDLEGGQGNFYMKPNGVFCVTSNRAAIVESSKLGTIGIRPRLACQSGPLLVNEGQIHPDFRPQSTNFHVRSGVGVSRNGTVVFAISREKVRFYDFAKLFKDKLECDNALYLDGLICAICLPELGDTADKTSTHFAGMWVVTVPIPSNPK